jgi:hypothetical protein
MNIENQNTNCMDYTAKPRSDSRLKALPDERQAEIATFATDGGTNENGAERRRSSLTFYNPLERSLALLSFNL